MQGKRTGALALPPPDARSLAHSGRVARRIHEAIEEAGGSISFAEYMHLALYAPGLGYYAAGAAKFGAEGDFVTAPEFSPLFGRILARQCASVLRELPQAEVASMRMATALFSAARKQIHMSEKSVMVTLAGYGVSGR